MKSQTVEYRDIPGHPGYRVGSDGSVWSAWQRKRSTHNYPQPFLIFIGRTWRRMKTTPRSGYPSVMFGKKTMPHSVHVLMLLAFKGPCPPGNIARHIDDVKTNNTIDNLEWGTRLENTIDQKINGSFPCGEKVATSKLTADQVLEIRRLKGTGNQCSIAKRFNVGQPTISRIWSGKAWLEELKHLWAKKQ